METELKVESDEASAPASELAALTGESVSAAVTTAVRERLKREREKAAKLKRIRELATEIKANIQDPVSSSDPDEFYDEDGLPR